MLNASSDSNVRNGATSGSPTQRVKGGWGGGKRVPSLGLDALEERHLSMERHCHAPDFDLYTRPRDRSASISGTLSTIRLL